MQLIGELIPLKVSMVVSHELIKASLLGLITGVLAQVPLAKQAGSITSTLEQLGDELRFVFITSAAQVAPLGEAPADSAEGDGFRVVVGASAHEKCIRCWHRREDVGTHSEHPEICGRCVDNISGPGEQRAYA